MIYTYVLIYNADETDCFLTQINTELFSSDFVLLMLIHIEYFRATYMP